MKMNRKIKTAWVKALRSGEYTQTKEHMRDETGYCCLGVLCEVTTGNKLPVSLREYPGRIVAKKCGLPAQDKNLNLFEATKDNPMEFLANKNDSGWSFKKIANWIEKNL